ncbi:hypothetical protein C8J57DRAFT_1338310 [Mycena rebaudengoi]|nr:hypothetical protein C8J57DRAFT_1338310 [Mycena rebaudengoi]
MNVVDIQTQLNLGNYLGTISFTLLFYDYILTFGWEVSRYWGSPLTFPTVLFYLNRYGTTLGNIPVIFEYFWTTRSTPAKEALCKNIQAYHQYLIIVAQVIVGIMLVMRTYALYERNKRVLVFMIVVSCAAVGVAAWSVVGRSSGSAEEEQQEPPPPQYIGCPSQVPKSASLDLAIAWISMAVFDCMIFLLTLYRALSRHHSSGMTLLTVLLRDGSIYFGVMVLANLSNIITILAGTNYTRGIATTSTNVISTIMISRLMLNLRDPVLSTLRSRGGMTITSGEVVFSTAMGPDAFEMTGVQRIWIPLNIYTDPDLRSRSGRTNADYGQSDIRSRRTKSARRY